MPEVRGQRDPRRPVRAGLRRARELVAEHGDDTPIALGAPRRALRREARDARRLDRRPDRRRRPDQGRRRPLARRRAHDPLRPAAAHQPRDLLHQRAARPHGEGAGRPVQRDGRARRADQGLPVRLPLDVLVVASANPEDYTSRGRIITPLKDRYAAQIRTHYPRDARARARGRASRRRTLPRAGRRGARARVHGDDHRAS